MFRTPSSSVKAVFIFALVTGFWLSLPERISTAAVTQTSSQLTATQLEFFEKKIRPVLAEHCYSCHSAQARNLQAALRLDTRDGMLKGGASGQPAIVPGEPDKSLLITAIRYTDAKLQMPFTGRLPDAVIRDFEAWVKMGAPDPRTSDAIATASNRQPYDYNEAKKFWSFQPVKDHQPSVVKNEAWIKTPIDRFILARLQEKNLKPIADADKLTLIRRATFDLTGLPPTPEEIDAFINDSSANAFERVVDRLLASTAYGERWGRHWLDVVRYADTAGCNSDFPIPSAYKYRNYVIDAFNHDKPYDQFIKEQLAGDILAGHRSSITAEKLPDEEADEAVVPGGKKATISAAEKARHEKIIATGYLAMSRRFGSRNKEFELTIDDTIDNLGKAFLGLSTSCARCHDHKFDPIPMRDYYALYGIFNSSRYAFPGQEIYPHPAGFIPLASGKEAAKFEKLQQELTDLDDRREFLTAEKGYSFRNKKLKEQQASTTENKAANNKTSEQTVEKKETQQKESFAKQQRPADFDRDADNWGRASQTLRLPEEVDAELRQVKARIADLHNQKITIEKAYAVVEGFPRNARIYRKGERKNLGDEVPRGFLTILGGQQVPTNHSGSGRELLANWIADANNPLTARVMVNRIWQYHFGKGLVQTPNDFGSRGKAPTHPELLDWLASRFIEGGWSVKKIHRLMMLSHVYQLASQETTGRQGDRETGRWKEAEKQRNREKGSDKLLLSSSPHLPVSPSFFAANAAIDVNNDYLWRFNRRRLDAEEVRDAILFVSDTLDRTAGDAHPFPPEKDWRFTQHEQFFATYETNRRSVYLMQQRLKKHPFMELFDGADQSAITAPRPVSTTPLQALFLMNSPLMHQQSDQFAVRVGLAFDTLRERMDYAFRLAYGRTATPEELREAAAYLQQTRQELQAAKVPAERLNRAALASYLRVVLSSNEFLYVD